MKLRYTVELETTKTFTVTKYIHCIEVAEHIIKILKNKNIIHTKYSNFRIYDNNNNLIKTKN